MTNKELVEVSNRAWDAFVDQLPKEFTGRDLLKIIIRFVVNTANVLDMKPITVCMMMYDRLNDELVAFLDIQRDRQTVSDAQLSLAETQFTLLETYYVLINRRIKDLKRKRG
jgi:hypothetical protein